MNLHKISYGIDHTIKLEDQLWILNKYHNYLKNIYISVPDPVLQKKFTLRAGLFTNSYDLRYTNIIINHARSLGLEINFTLNKNPKAFDKSLYSIIESYKPDEICTLDELLNLLKSNCDPRIKYIRSFYNSSNYDAKIYTYDTAIYKNHIVLHLNLINSTLGVRIILNFACPWICKLCGDYPLFATLPSGGFSSYTANHRDLFLKELTSTFNSSLEKYFAYHLWSGEDINKFEERFSTLDYSYKFANRTMSFTVATLDQSLDTYTNGKMFKIERSKLVNIGHIPVDFNTLPDELLLTYKHFNYDRYLEYKKEYWELVDKKLKENNTTE